MPRRPWHDHHWPEHEFVWQAQKSCRGLPGLLTNRIMHTPSPKSLAPAPLRYPPPFFVFRFSLRTYHDTSLIHTLHEYGIPSNKPPRSCRNGWYRPPPIGIYDWATTFSPVSSCSTTSESSSLSLELHDCVCSLLSQVGGQRPAEFHIGSTAARINEREVAHDGTGNARRNWPQRSPKPKPCWNVFKNKTATVKVYAAYAGLQPLTMTFFLSLLGSFLSTFTSYHSTVGGCTKSIPHHEVLHRDDVRAISFSATSRGTAVKWSCWARAIPSDSREMQGTKMDGSIGQFVNLK